MCELDDVTLSTLAAICQSPESPEFFEEVRSAVELAHFRKRIEDHAQALKKVANATALLIQEIDSLNPEARVTFEEILGDTNDLAKELKELFAFDLAEHGPSTAYEQQTPFLFWFLKNLWMFERLANWMAGLRVPYLRSNSVRGSRFLELGIDGKPLSSRGRGRPRGSKGLSSGYENLELFVDHLTRLVEDSGGRLTFHDHHCSGTLVDALKLLERHLPSDCRAMPPKSTMRRIKERSMRHLHRTTPETLYEGKAPVGGPEHHEAVAQSLRAAGIDPATVNPDDLACAAEIHAREGAPPGEAFQIAVALSLINSGYIDQEIAKKAGFGSPVRPRKSKMRRTRKRSSK